MKNHLLIFTRCLLVTFTFVSITSFANGETPMLKRPNVAGQFYDANPARLSQFVDMVISQADVKPLDQYVGAILVPHAGYVFSGWVEAYAYKAASHNQYKTVILLGPTHYYDFEGVAIWPKGGFQTPLGTVEVDEEFAQKLMAKCPSVHGNPQIFERDHVLEVELPFLQRTFSGFKIVPLIMDRDNSRQALEDVAQAIYEIVGDRQDVLLLVSSDQSHFHTDQVARELDTRGLKAVEEMDVDRLWKENRPNGSTMEIDGFKEIITAILYAQKKGLTHAKLLKYANSGDVTGEKDRVVGYGAMIIY